ncbi:MAG: sodium/glutamate symporter [Endozoicomonadaceae bacterium]|nr:sodium/glutamate symporter [Endozoicomonadaceae bacterium]
MHFQISGLAFLSISILIIYLGSKITQCIPVLKSYNIPPAITSGLLVAIILTIVSYGKNPLYEITFDLTIRNLFLLTFFSCIGLSTKLSILRKGGTTLLILILMLTGLILCQNIIGLLSATLFDIHPIYGLLAGSISFAGGHGTAITWVQYLQSLGFENINEFALVSSTLGLILGGFLGGPIGQMLMNNKKLITPNIRSNNPSEINLSTPIPYNLSSSSVFGLLFSISITIVIGLEINNYLRQLNILLPDFFIVLILGVLLNNILDSMKHSLHSEFTALLSDISLDLFVVMSLFTLNLNNLFHIAFPLLFIACMQTLFIAVFAYYVFFRYAGRDYDAAVMSSGFIGSGLGATPVGIANVETMMHRFGKSPKAMLFIPLLGSVFTDITNSIILQSLIKIPFIGTP